MFLVWQFEYSDSCVNINVPVEHFPLVLEGINTEDFSQVPLLHD